MRTISKWKRVTQGQLIWYALTVFCLAVSIVFVYHNYSFYERPIATVTEVELVHTEDVQDMYDNPDTMYIQELIAEVKNGKHKGKRVQLNNKYSKSGAYDQPLSVGNDVFISFDKADGDKLTGGITDIKRDKYLVIGGWIFLLTLLLVGKRQGFYAGVSLAINIILLSYALDLYIATEWNLLWICGVLVVLFTVLSLLLVNGWNGKTYAAIVATLLGTFGSILITVLVMWVTSEQGLFYEEMQFLTRPYRLVFLAGLFIGSLGAVMDVAISISAALFELYQKNPQISEKALKASGIDIGRDIMGTMTNILFFAYVSGSMPVLILYLKNYSPLVFTLSINLSLELARALAGGIGIVITIPIGLYVTLFFIHRKKAKS